MELIKKIRQSYLDFKDKIFLKRHGCENWNQYNRLYDPDYNIRGNTVKEYYHGYPYINCFENHEHNVYFWDLGYDGIYVLNKWCEENIKDKWRIDIIRVHGWNCIHPEDKNTNKLYINDIGGKDFIFIAFKDERDFLMFSLRYL